ncbi:hypothetical protein [Caballeronia mineralivorans]|jgi:hypothetical protein|uniref:hypothetical protein n=1 Tax=Caballeronia mineralivorans TaxID=2010198 RepID=UPI0023EFD52E|nr:hypothetical protein [Caballeronia mineralivorans]MDB5789824.1 hypothetical protein [Caballeronia mineralivorans]MEA3104306.1 hypothetical protein [Caballeronia mineralivorans]
MKRGIPEHKEAQAVVLARMAATRAELVATSHLPKIGGGANRTARHVSPNAGPVFLRSPNAALLAVLLVGSVIIGPRRILVTSFRACLTAWITRTVRALAGG